MCRNHINRFTIRKSLRSFLKSEQENPVPRLFHGSTDIFLEGFLTDRIKKGKRHAVLYDCREDTNHGRKKVSTPEEQIGDHHLHTVSGGSGALTEEISGKAGLTSSSTGSVWCPVDYYWHGNLVSVSEAYAIAAFYKEFGREPESVSEAVDFCRKQPFAFKEIS